jgi:hypothetical protein
MMTFLKELFSRMGAAKSHALSKEGHTIWLFAGSDNGGRTAAVLFSFTATCRRLNINPFAYLQDVLTRLPMHPAERLHELLPDQWVPPASPSIFPA